MERRKMKQRKTSLILKTTRDCNMRCKYCYIPYTKKIMSTETVENIVKKFTSVFEEVSFIWHGGEPLLAGKDFYQDLVKLQKKYERLNDCKINNDMQTNAVLLNEKYIDFLLENDFSIGISSDGPQEIQDLTRPLFSGKGSYLVVDKNIKECVRKTSAGNKSTGGICVASKCNFNKAEDIYDYYKSVNLPSMQILSYMGTDAELKLSSEEYFVFHQQMYDTWVSDPDPLRRVAPITTIVKRILGGERAAYANELPICDYAGSCFYNFYTIDVNGDFLPCCAIDKPVLGNINTDSIEDILASKELNQLQQVEDAVKADCQSSCNYHFICQGGCRGASYLTHGDLSTKDSYCDGKRKLFSYIRKDLELKLGLAA